MAKRGRLFVLLAATLVAAWLVLWQVGYIALWTVGMASIVNNTQDFTDENSHIVAGEYSVLIDLSDLKSNIGKELLNDGSHQIIVGSVDNTGSRSTGGYRIGFRSKGAYSLSGASLISGAQHDHSDNGFTTTMSAKMIAEYNGNSYECSVMGYGGINFKDGDDFYFYIFPSEAYDSKKVTTEETGVVQLTVSNLYENRWTRQSSS
ncbi:hypothetical protein [Paenibacillus sp. HB172176]|uniref:hypothetical protein n=1 Tax=Paenibacillus sp. HB172176 TaxID=2493690 RepID=UPI001439A05B|nr:hypothetical protein [Paenibacillus sp. HB172176]